MVFKLPPQPVTADGIERVYKYNWNIQKTLADNGGTFTEMNNSSSGQKSQKKQQWEFQLCGWLYKTSQIDKHRRNQLILIMTKES